MVYRFEATLNPEIALELAVSLGTLDREVELVAHIDYVSLVRLSSHHESMPTSALP